MAKSKVLYRVRYDKNYRNQGEYYVVECYDNNDKEWYLDCAYPFMDKLGTFGRGEYVHFELVTKIRELMKLGFEIIWK